MQLCALVIIPVTSYNLYFYSLNSLEYPSSFHNNTFRSAELLEVTWGCWLTRSSTCPSNVHWQPQKQMCPGLHHKQCGQKVKKGVSVTTPLSETPPWVLLPALGPAGASPKERHQNDHRARAPQLWRQAGRVGVVQPGQEKAPGKSYSNFPVPTRREHTRRMERDFWHGYELIGQGFKLKEA